MIRCKTITQPDRIHELLRPWHRSASIVKIERAVVYTFHSALQRLAARTIDPGGRFRAPIYRRFLGQGTCSGCARRGKPRMEAPRRNYRGIASEQLLDTYETERMEHVRALFELAVELRQGDPNDRPREIARQRDPRHDRKSDDVAANSAAAGPAYTGDARLPPVTRAAQPRSPDGRSADMNNTSDPLCMLADRSFRRAVASQRQHRMIEMGYQTCYRADGEAADYLYRACTEAVIIRPDRHILGIASTRAT